MRRLSLVCLAAALALAGCGDADAPVSPPAAGPKAGPAKLPSAEGRSLDVLRRLARGHDTVMAPTQSIVEPAAEPVRFGFGLFDREHKAINDAPVALYVAPERSGGARGPYLARAASLKVDAPFRSQSSAGDPDAAAAFYLARVPFENPGRYRLLALAHVDGRLVASDEETVDVRSQRAGPPRPGERAISVHTETADDVHGDLTLIDTRIPPSTMHADDLADVLGKEPVVLLFATPLLCKSRVCGPVVDVAEQVKAKLGDKAAFIHQEIYADNRVDHGFRPQVRAWRLSTEPWAFVIDARGTVVARFEGAFSADELERAVRRAVDSGA